MCDEDRNVTFQTLNRDEIVDLFNTELQKVLDNMVESAKAKIKIKVIIKSSQNRCVEAIVTSNVITVRLKSKGKEENIPNTIAEFMGKHKNIIPGLLEPVKRIKKNMLGEE